MATRKSRTSDSTKQALFDELAHKRKEMERVFTRGELLKDLEYAFVRRLQSWAKKLPEPKKPFVLVTVSGGVATIWEHPSVDAEVVDWDNWDGQDPTRNELAELRETAERIQDRNDREAFLRQVQELEDRGVAEDEEDEEDEDDEDDEGAELCEMTKVEIDDRRRRRKQIPGRNQVGTATS